MASQPIKTHKHQNVKERGKNMKPLLEQDRFLSINEITEYVGVNNQVVRKWLREGTMPGTKFGRLWRIHTTTLAEFIEQQNNQTKGGV